MLLRDAPVLIMDTDYPEVRMLHGHTAVGLETRGRRKLPVLLFTNSILTCACVALCVYTIYRTQEKAWHGPLPVDRGIYMNLLKVSPDSPYLNFSVTWNNELKLEYGSEVMVPCPGPYVFFICANLQGNGTKGNLTLSQGHRNFSFELFATLETRCVRHQKVISLYEKEKVTFSFENKYDEEYIFLEDLQVGLHYLLGTRNIITPDFGPL
ncbi:uncharacterized protein LOC132882954 [Neoarius graeffei]|uniref:uncharacterized protein LOC132882954 n=1 Tax=Neoarius graeffei TaxID=443677 RepID=UPI00298CADA5|nr:uncharacterized protein LOC132882954 [Neoarius graeffei]